MRKNSGSFLESVTFNICVTSLTQPLFSLLGFLFCENQDQKEPSEQQLTWKLSSIVLKPDVTIGERLQMS